MTQPPDPIPDLSDLEHLEAQLMDVDTSTLDTAYPHGYLIGMSNPAAGLSLHIEVTRQPNAETGVHLIGVAVTTDAGEHAAIRFPRSLAAQLADAIRVVADSMHVGSDPDPIDSGGRL